MAEYFNAPYPARSTVEVVGLPRGCGVRSRRACWCWTDRTAWRAPSAPAPALAAVGETPLTALPGCGPRVAEKLAARGLACLQDLWLQLPRQYEDRTRLTPIRALQPGVAAQVEGRVEAVERGFRYRPMLRVAIGDDSRRDPGAALLPFPRRAGRAVRARRAGALLRHAAARASTAWRSSIPSYRMLDDADDAALGEQLDPVYPAIEGIGPASLRRLIGLALDRLPGDDALELLPRLASCCRWRLQLPSLREALLTVHRPAQGSRHRRAAGRHASRAAPAGAGGTARAPPQPAPPAHRAAGARARRCCGGWRLAERLREALPFALTGAQQRVFEEIRADLGKPRRCCGWCRATSAAARPWSPRWRRCSRSRPASRPR